MFTTSDEAALDLPIHRADYKVKCNTLGFNE